jgi:hypothetical protein
MNAEVVVTTTQAVVTNKEVVVTTIQAVVINAEIKVNRSPTTQHPTTINQQPSTIPVSGLNELLALKRLFLWLFWRKVVIECDRILLKC